MVHYFFYVKKRNHRCEHVNKYILNVRKKFFMNKIANIIQIITNVFILLDGIPKKGRRSIQGG